MTGTTKTKLTADELASIYATKIGVMKDRVIITKNDYLGWTATIIAHPGDASHAADAAEQLTAALRLAYELKD